MDLRRPPRSSSGGVEPKIRQVGFFTPDASAPSELLPPAAAVPAPLSQLRSAGGSPPASEDLSPGRLSPVMIPPPRHVDNLAPGPPSPAALATSAPVLSSPRLDVASEIGDDDSWSRVPSAVELEENKRGLAEIQNEGAPASIPQKQKTSKAERRAIQEAQSAAKAAAKEADKSGKFAGAAISKQAKPRKKVGLKYLSGEVSGGNGRCIAMLLAFREAIKDYTTPPNKTLGRDLAAKISSYVSFLIECRPLSISMGNAIRFLKSRIAKLPHALSESEAKTSLQSDIDRFINEKIVLADKVIVSHAITKVRDNDVLLTYGSSSVVEMILDYAHELGRNFRVVVDSRPKLEGQGLLQSLVGKGINCTYAHINAISYIMHEVTRVLLGASSILSNGTVYSRVGTASVAMVAHAFGVPVLVCCEAYKFHERVQLDSICANELGDPDVILKIPGKAEDHLKNWTDNANLQLLNLTYDATPPDYVSMIITDYGMVRYVCFLL
ncbi:Translation initiation factor eIF-2B subunit delta [Zea mays]|uniref:Translation initiation factor eIF2B subunit delta n=1 Tax=Zea mays TaxID=4577 RepID=A0A317YAH9_MAIZE|nr:Translation initiation factor eIF-2B subunit delta [Zea mays]